MTATRKPRVPEHLRRVLVCARVMPRTLAYLESFGEANAGRAIDRLADAHKAVMRAMKPEKRTEFDKPARLPLD